MNYPLVVDNIVRGAKLSDQRTGQYLFNRLPSGAASMVAGALFDPFNRDLSPHELDVWLSEHCVFSDQGEIIAIFNNNTFLWESRFHE